MKKPLSIIACSLAPIALLAACNNAQDAAEDRVEAAAENSAAAAGPAPVALGLSEQQLLDADLVDAAGKDLGDVEAVLRGADGQVDRLLVEVDGTSPDKFVHVAIADLSPVQTGNDWDLRTTMTKAQLTALPDAPLATAPAGAPATTPAGAPVVPPTPAP